MTESVEIAGGIVVDGRRIEARDGDTVAMAIVRAGEPPARGGTLCLAGDCGNCLGVVDGLAYVRTCQVPARAGTVVERHPIDANPTLPGASPRDEIAVERRVVERVVIGGGRAGRAAARDGDPVLDAHDGIEVVGIYPGPTVIARTPDGVLHLEADEIVVATGATEIQPVCPGNDLDGLLTPRAADRLRAAGIDLRRAGPDGRAGARPVRGRRHRTSRDGRDPGNGWR